jgi:hypothetical protein
MITFSVALLPVPPTFISNYGTGAVVATCSENNYALGCGQKSGLKFMRLFRLD